MQQGNLPSNFSLREKLLRLSKKSQLIKNMQGNRQSQSDNSNNQQQQSGSASNPAMEQQSNGSEAQQSEEQIGQIQSPEQEVKQEQQQSCNQSSNQRERQKSKEEYEMNSQQERQAEAAFNLIHIQQQQQKGVKSNKNKATKKDKNDKISKTHKNIMMEEQQINPERTKNKKSSIHSQVENKIKSILKNYDLDPVLKSKKKKKIAIDQGANKQYIVLNEGRKWNEQLQNPKKGKFDPSEKKILIKSLSQCLNEKDISLEQLLQSLKSQQDQKVPKDLHLWTNVCSVLTDRPLVSSYKFLRRQLSLKNRGGQWSEQQTQKLKQLVSNLGKRWSKISKQMKRTPQNVRDKYRALVSQSDVMIQKQMWKLSELVAFLQLLEQQSNLQFLSTQINNELERSQHHDQLQLKQLERKKYNSKTFIFHNNILVRNYINFRKFNSIKTDEICWNKISKQIGTKTLFDCRNKFLQILMIETKGNEQKEHFHKQIIRFILQQNVKNQAEIKWNLWNDRNNMSNQQAKNRFMIFKRTIQGRGQKLFSALLNEMKIKVGLP